MTMGREVLLSLQAADGEDNPDTTMQDPHSVVPEEIQQCVHDVFAQDFQSRSGTSAICSWDGEMTYGELDEASTRLACYLASLAVGPESLVLLCFEKSMWAVVAMLAVLKAGGAFVPLDPGHPTSRHEEIFKQTEAKMVLSSVQHSGLWGNSPRSVVVVSEASISQLPPPVKEMRSAVTPSNAAYVIFTSGSTGVPKGVVLEHQTVITSCLGHGKAFGFTKDTRMLQFASYTFDACIAEILTTLLHGGCVCVPSESSRHDDLATAMSSMDVNWALLTPTVARLVDPSKITSLKVLVFIGEQVSTADTERWGDVQLINGYGPTECCVFCTAHVGANGFRTGNIGKSIASVSWVVDPENHNKLAPLGSVGELLIEGPILARGYLNDQAKTDAAFIEDPTWLVEGGGGHPGRRGRLYKTGDLVRYDSDGNLIYVGRKDGQVKVRGQRVELGEIEHHVRECMPDARQVVVEMIEPGGEKDKAMLAAFIQLHDDSSTLVDIAGQDNSEPQDLFSAKIRESLAEQLPGYMVPSVFFALRHIPINASGKTDRKRLREIGVSFSIQQLVRMQASSQESKQRPLTGMECKLKTLIAKVLNLPFSDIRMDDSLLRLGGDSISAMQLVSLCRANDISLTTKDVLKARHIEELATFIKPNLESEFEETTNMDQAGLAFELSPIQQMYIGKFPSRDDCFDQCFYLRLTRPVSPSAMSQALEVVVRDHAALRARIVRQADNSWRQIITDDVSGSLRWQCHQLDDADAVEELVADSRRSLDFGAGPIVAANLCEIDNVQTFFITIHHLFVDLVSWRIILQDIEELLLNGNVSCFPSTSFQTWCQLQLKYARRWLTPETVLPFDINPPFLSFWGLGDQLDAWHDTIQREIILDTRTTTSLLGECNQRFCTEPVELFIAGLIQSFHHEFKDRDIPTVFNEGHGRELWDEKLDLSRTVGWFTTLSPIQCNRETTGNITDTIRRVKDCRRSLPHKGWSYFTSRFLNSEGIVAFQSQTPLEILLNYHGIYQQFERPDALFQQEDFPGNQDLNVSLQGGRFAIFVVSIAIEMGKAVVSFTYNRQVKHQDRIARWIQKYSTALHDIVAATQGKSRQLTLSDLPLSFQDYNDLDRFVGETLPSLGISKIEDVENAYQCSSMQQAILFDRMNHPDHYWIRVGFELIQTDHRPAITTWKLQRSWKAIVNRHTILRTTFVLDCPGISGPVQIVLRERDAGVAHVSVEDPISAASLFTNHQNVPEVHRHGLEHHLTIYKMMDGTLFCVLEINHAIIDGYSLSLLFHELGDACSGLLEPASAPPYGDFVSFIQHRDISESLKYWKGYLHGVEPCLYPSLYAAYGKVEDDMVLRVDVPFEASIELRSFCNSYEFTPFTVIQAAWALTLSKVSNTTSACFGYLSSGRHLPVNRIEDMVGPTISMIVCLVSVRGSLKILEMLQKVQIDTMEGDSHQPCSLASIQNALGLGERRLFSTSISFQKPIDGSRGQNRDVIIQRRHEHDPSEYDVTVHVDESESSYEMALTYRTARLSTFEAKSTAITFSQAIQAIVGNPDARIQDISLVSKKELEKIFEKNSKVSASMEQCIHGLIRRNTRNESSSPAICSWDGEMSYGELDEASTSLAGLLVNLGIKPEDIVPLCFEKSMWTVVAMLAVLKAGGAFVPLDPEHPAGRQEEIFKQTGAKVVLTSAQGSTLWESLPCNVVLVSKASIGQLPLSNEIRSTVTPRNAAYIIFTSGSTGVPKGVVLEHQTVITSCLGHGKAFGFTKDTRMLQFASYTFDACIAEILTTLLHSGCVCIPSEHGRCNDLAISIKSMDVNWALLTPTVARLLDPSTVSLKALVFIGEQVSTADTERWGDVQLINGYGPTECCVFCTAHVGANGFRTGNIGKSIASVSWVVDPENHNKLAPLGSVGELLIEGPILARGYLNDQAKTDAAFIEDPTWLVEGGGGHPGRRGRLYKTGDLVRYDSDGNLIYVGRKDGQVKVRGQRVELGEIEHHVQECMPKAQQVAVEVILPAEEPDSAMLAAFLKLDEELYNTHLTRNAIGDGSIVHLPLAEVEEKLAERLPKHMVPTVFFALRTLPMTASGKTDRKQLREIGASFSAQQLAEIRTTRQNLKRCPSTNMELALRQLWAKVLQVEVETIGLDDSFFQLGGDSIAAMKLVAEARRNGMELSVANIFQNSTLKALAMLGSKDTRNFRNEIESFSILGPGVSVANVREEVASICNIDVGMVEDIYPCSPVQEGMISLTLKRSGDYVMRSVLELQDNVDQSGFQVAWEQVARSIPTLRTRIVQHSSLGLLQAVIEEKIRWMNGEGLENYLQLDKAISMDLGEPLVRYALVKEPQRDKLWFVWTVHHALYDGWSLPRILDAVRTVYTGGVLEPLPKFNVFIEHISQQDPEAMKAYWQESLAEHRTTPFPLVPADTYQPLADGTAEYRCALIPKMASNITPSTLIRAAWAIVASCHTNSNDVVFGATVSGRNAPVAGIEDIVGPAIATVPLRVRVMGDQSVCAFLEGLQRQATDMIPFEQAGIQRISKMGIDAENASKFQTLLVVQPADDALESDTVLGEWHNLSDLRAFATYSLVLQCTVNAERCQTIAAFDTRVIPHWLVENILGQFGSALQQLAGASPESKVGDMDILPSKEKERIWNLNDGITRGVERGVLGLFNEQAQTQPDAPAIYSWDGRMTYGELDKTSTRLSCYLASLGVGPESLVPLCFEKSVWAVVAMLAVLKAGGAFAPLDPGHPTNRQEEVFKQTGARVVLTSAQCSRLWESLPYNVVAVSAASISQLPAVVDKLHVGVTPRNAAYVIFTSGSTGVPKGVVLEHQAVVTGCLGHGKAFGVRRDTRMLQFASYTFDACIAEILTTLLHGGCVCIPSEHGRRNDLAKSINRMSANCAILTPTVARLLDPEQVTSLKTLVLGGERVSSSDCDRWTGKVNVINGYGPAECCVCSAAYTIDNSQTFASGTIGRSVASVSWIVDPENHNKLAPLGSVGELLIEGPILARGYLNDQAKTDAAFIEDPTWLVEGGGGHPGRRGRLYKTGDLVRYDSDGNLIYVGRKDGQVKVRGQRVELGEVEHHVRECMPDARQVVVEMIEPGGEKDKAMLAAFFQHIEKTDSLLVDSVLEDSSAAQAVFPVGLETRLAERLPGHMVPTVFFELRQFPQTASGKTNRRRLREIGASFSAQDLAQARTSSHGPKRQPSTETERSLQQLWARVLNIEPDSIGLDDSFFRLGGDSITAMRISSSARALHLNISTSDILRKKTINQIACHVTLFDHYQVKQAEESMNMVFSLSPVQLLYFHLEPTGKTSFDQCFLLRLNNSVNIHSVQLALRALVQRHSMLRARFCRKDTGQWRQYISSHIDASLVIEHLYPDNSLEATQAMLQCRTLLNIKRGPTVAAVFSDRCGPQTLFIAVHHLVIDLVSWRVLLEDLEDILLGRPLQPTSSISFQAWQTIQAKHTADHLSPSDKIYSRMNQNHLSYWGKYSGGILHKNIVRNHFILDKTTTTALLGTCNDAFQTRVLELLIAALIHSFATVFPDRKPPAIFNETHGREAWDDSIDLSRTVGWFTSMFPVEAEVTTSGSLLDVIRKTKDCMRSFRDSGRSYFASHFVDDISANDFASTFPVEVMFNYQGVYQQLERKDSLFTSLPVPDGCDPASAEKAQRFALFDVSVVIQKGCMHVAITSDSGSRHQVRIRDLIEQYRSTLADIPILLQNRSPEWTLSDFPLAFQSYQDLDEFLHCSLPGLGLQVKDIEDIFPCSPMQEGILASQSKDSHTYRTCFVYQVASTLGEKVCCTRLQKAWKAVVRQHVMLRTVFADQIPGSSGIINLVLKDPQPSMSCFQSTEETVTIELFRAHHNPTSQRYGSLQHHLSICQLENQKVLICLDINHALIDAHSRSILLCDLQTAYQTGLHRDGASFRDVILYIGQQSQEEANRYWTKYLEGAEPCHFPSFSEFNDRLRKVETVPIPEIDESIVLKFCQEWEVTPATIIQAAWSLVLNRYTGSTAPCFGNLSSGRDLPIDNINEVFGPLINMLPCRINLNEQLTVLDVLRSVQNDYLNSLPYQTFPLASVHKILGLEASALFNTALSLQRIDDMEQNETSDIHFDAQEGLDPTEYDIVISGDYSATALKVVITFQTSCRNQCQRTYLARALSKAIHAIVIAPNSCVQDLNLVTDSERQYIWGLNSVVPRMNKQLIHKMIEEEVKSRPHAPAILSWDGEMTYGELDEASTRLSYHLASLGIGPESFVPLCFEKSMWVVVAMLAVLKAGGAFVPLDPGHPTSRHEEIFKQTEAKMVLSSVQHSVLWGSSPRSVVVVSEASISVLPPGMGAVDALFEPSNAAYIIFTSGSTGAPKGVVLEHQAVVTGCLGHGKAFGVRRDTRMLQFASYTFDACIAEILTTLLHGGCVCIPSESSRHDDLGTAMSSMNVNWALLTPTVAQLLNPEQVSSLTALVFGGEKVNSNDCEKWTDRVTMINGYGPTECCVCSAAYTIGHSQTFTSGTIGRSVASVSWIVDPANHNKLAPLGSVGELLIEGPILARGYLNDQAKTDAAFIEDPTWLVEGGGGHPGRRGRLYKTGDLVRYDSEGNLVYVGRKDGQVKVRGQRVELGEIEHHVRECMPEARQVVIEMIEPGGEKDKAMLAAFFQHIEKTDSPLVDSVLEDGSAAQVVFPVGLETRLAERLPGHMVPTVFFKLRKLPTTTSGKTDRKQLRDIGASFSTQQLAHMCKISQDSKRRPWTETERALQQLWARVLNIEPDSIGLDDSFFRLGGDSITAMRISSSARALHLNISTSDILRKKTINQIARQIPLSEPIPAGFAPETVGKEFGLSPIQDLYLQLEPSGKKSFDQCFFLQFNAKIELSSLRAALRALVQRHPMLRARFDRSNPGKWEQHISDQIDTSLEIQHVRTDTLLDHTPTQFILQSRDYLNIERGPIMAVVLFDGHDNQKVFIAVHHLVIDLVSWRVLLEDLEDILLGRPLQPTSSISFQAWQALQLEHMANHLSPSHSTDLAQSQLSYWGECPDILSYKSVVRENFMLDNETTSALLGACNDAFSTRPLELMIAALIHSFATVFPDRDTPAIFNETHGRETWNNDIDLTRTIGWFTSMFPVKLSSSANKSLFDIIRETKDFMRSVEHNGWSYFASQFVDENSSKDLALMFPVEVIFNYQGVYQQLEHQDSLFTNLSIPDGCEPESAVQAPRFALFEMSVVVEQGNAHVHVIRDSRTRHQERMVDWIKQYRSTLVEVSNIHRHQRTVWTLSDFPLAFKSYQDLDEFRNSTLPGLGLKPEDVEDVFSCSPVQEGILASQSKDADAYWTCFMYEVVPLPGTQVSCTRLQQAWEAVVLQHALLRTLLVDNVPGSSGVNNVILKTLEPSTSYFQAAEDTATLQLFRSHCTLPASIKRSSGPQHHLSICQLDNQKVFVCLDINHAIIDAHSRGILLRDLQAAYTSTKNLHINTTSFRDVVIHLHQQSQEEASRYWIKYLNGIEPCYFPSMLEAAEEPDGPRHGTVQVHDLDAAGIHEFCQRWEITPATIAQMAWALVLKSYTGYKTVCFGNLSSGRDLPIDNINDVFGPLITMVTCSVRFDKQQTVLEVLRSVQMDYLNSLAYQSFPLASVHKSLQLESSALFNTALSLQRMDDVGHDCTSSINFQSYVGKDPTEYDIIIGASYDNSSIEMGVTFNTAHISRIQAAHLTTSLGKAISLITKEPSRLSSDIDLMGKEEKRQIWAWNHEIPLVVDQCIQSRIVFMPPTASAILSWDGEMTYGELDEASTRLAYHLASLGIGPESFVPLCFEKSMWVVVAMLAVLKAGGAFVPLDPDHPTSRHEEIFKQTGARVVLTSDEYSRLWRDSLRSVVVVSEASISQLPLPVKEMRSAVTPSNAAYVIFTSGSTGVPKGVVLEHRAVVTSCLSHGKAFGFTKNTRVLQFASYTFDACITEIFTTLLHGGCICIPSESSRRNDLAYAINAMEVNWALLTPTVARLLDPDTIPSLKTLTFGGEQATTVDWERWGYSVDRINAYGPAESCVISIMHQDTGPFRSGTIGRSVASVGWVVDPENHNKLAPLGSVGELLIEGPILARGYLNDQAKTDAAFIEDPTWLVEGGGGHPGRRGRLYKTGDLVRYDSEGNLVYVGRKDGQVKVRGQRVELGEIEHHVRECMPEARQVVIEMIEPGGEKDKAMLAAFFQHIEKTDSPLVDSVLEDGSAAQVVFPVGLETRLAERLPGHMVPTAFFILQHLPVNTSGKTDRRRLREIGASFSAQDLAQARTSSHGPKRQPSTETERSLQQLWGQVLNIEPDNIGLDDNFFRLGGDSIKAMKMVGEARQKGLHMTVADVFRYSRLGTLASTATIRTCIEVEDIAAFSLIGSSSDIIQVRAETAAMCGVNASDVKDIYPCSSLQEGLMSLTSKRPGDYIMQSVLKLRADIDMETFRAAWEQVVQAVAVLRTRIVHNNRCGLLQAVIAEDVRWAQTEGLEEYLKHDNSVPMKLGEPLSRYALIGDQETGTCWFVWTIHHALYDGWSLPRIVDAVRKLLHGVKMETLSSFRPFIKYIGQQDQHAATQYWQATLDNFQAPCFPPLPPTVREPVADTTIEYHCPPLPITPSDTTTSTLIRAALAIVISHYTDSDDVIFGATVNGRNTPVSSIETIIGPTIATVPVRVRLALNATVCTFLEELQCQATKMIPFEQTGLQRIAKIGPQAHRACGFQTLLVVQPESDALESEEILGEWHTRSGIQQFTAYGLTLNCTLAPEGVQITAGIDTRIIELWLVKKLLGQLSSTMQQLVNADIGVKVADIAMHTTEDKQELWTRNCKVPMVFEQHIHYLFLKQAQTQLDAPAICSWDGEMTYGELDEMSTRLACHLVNLGVDLESLVPLCFEKSMWAVVSMLAVLKAGGAFVPLDPDHPTSRHEEIFKQTGARVVLTSDEYSRLWRDSLRSVVVVSEASISQLPLPVKEMRSAVTPSNAAYVIFTSGSTGVPKGVVLEHQAVVTSCLGHGKAFGFTQNVRMLQFASYTFDACIAEILTTLLHGGCVCIPSEHGRRNDLAKSINRMSANCAILTPTVARLLDPENITSLKTLVFGGERVSSEDCDRWVEKVRVINGYGPAECCVCSAAYTIGHSQTFTSGTIGRSVASVSWIVDPANHNKLAPLGSVGELLIEGPILARGYLNDQAKTDAAFIEDPTWLVEGGGGHPGRRGRLYKTGDLVRYDSEGNLVYVGRKDGQVKVRGQRVELGEIEHHVRECMPEARQVVVEMIEPGGEKDKAMLAAFFQHIEKTDSPLVDSVLEDGSAAQAVFPAGLETRLAERLPGHMVPTVFFELRQFPQTASGKTNRRRLHEIGASFSAQDLAQARTSSHGLKRQPSTETERSLQQLWGQVLNIEPDSIGLDDSFFQLGGDSIKAMNLVAEARKIGHRLDVADIIRSPRLGHLTEATFRSTHNIKSEDAPVVQSPAVGDPVVDWYLETTLPEPSTLPELEASPRPNRKPEVVVLTGCSGLFGHHLLNTLATHPSIRKVICVAVRRLADHLQSGQLHPPSDRLVYYEGDLTQPQFGLKTEEWGAIFSEADAVIHNGASTSHVKHYSALRAVNVESTRQLVRACLQRMIPIHYISSAVVAMFAGSNPASAKSCTKTNRTLQTDGAQGYLCSKWVSESMLEQAHAKYGLRVVIHRPSNIIREGGDAVNERAQFDVVHALLYYAHKMEAVPRIENNPGAFHLVSVKTCCNDAVRELLQDGSSNGEIIYVNNIGDDVVPMAELAQIGINKVGKVYSVLSMEKWTKAAIAEGMHPAVAAMVESYDWC